MSDKPLATHLVVGYGEVGKALFEVLSGCSLFGVDAADIGVRVPEIRHHGTYDCIHFCTPVTTLHDLDATIMKAFEKQASAHETIGVIHSTVPLGTTRLLAESTGYRLVYSPVRGTHPDLRSGLHTFPKYIGGRDAARVSHWFHMASIPTKVYADPETPEAIKLWDTTQYGWQIVLAKEIAAWCKQHGLSFAEVYQSANRDYNKGYEKLDRPEVVRPSLKDMPGPIGGHCVMPNLALLGPMFVTNVIAAADARFREAADVLRRGQRDGQAPELASDSEVVAGLPVLGDGPQAVASDQLVGAPKE